MGHPARVSLATLSHFHSDVLPRLRFIAGAVHSRLSATNQYLKESEACNAAVFILSYTVVYFYVPLVRLSDDKYNHCFRISFFFLLADSVHLSSTQQHVWDNSARSGWCPVLRRKLVSLRRHSKLDHCRPYMAKTDACTNWDEISSWRHTP